MFINHIEDGTTGCAGRFSIIGISEEGWINAIGKTVMTGIVMGSPDFLNKTFCLIFLAAHQFLTSLYDPVESEHGDPHAEERGDHSLHG